jgi:hypothetical protein
MKTFFTIFILFAITSFAVADDINPFYTDEAVTVAYDPAEDDPNVFRLTFMHILNDAEKPYRWRVRNTSGASVAFKYGYYGSTKSETITLSDGEEYFFSTANSGTMKLFDANGNEFKNSYGNVNYLTTKASGDKVKTLPGIPIDGGLGILALAGIGFGVFRNRRIK